MSGSIADLAVLNAKIYTLDTKRPWVSALAVRDGKFLALGTDADVKAMVGAQTKIVDARGKLVLPGLIDSHAHAFEGARADLFELLLSPANSFDQMIEAVRAAAKQHKRPWLLGAGWSLPKLISQLSIASSLKSLDDATGNRPVVLRDSSHHAMFANSAAMKVAGIGQDTRFDGNGAIVRDQDGRLTGVFLENACSLIEDHVPPLSHDEKLQTALRAVAICHSFGVTGFTHAVTSGAQLQVFKELDDAGRLKAWIATCIANEPILTPEYEGIGAVTIAKRSEYRSQHVAVDFAKFFIDGVPASKTAAFAEPYLTKTDGVPDHTKTFYSMDELRDLIAPLDAQGIHVKVHAVGDQAVRTTLDAIEEVRRLNGATGTQHSIAHVSYIFDADIPRLAALNVVADLCPPLWFPNPILQGNAVVLGEERGHAAWPIADILRTGAKAVMGTDWPVVDTPNPWPGLASMITRKHPRGAFPGAFRPEQAVNLEQALPLCTINVAESMGFGSKTGSISEGKCADFIVLERDLFEIKPEEIVDTKVLQTYFSGELVYNAS